jgi:hypothetical protein
MGKNTILSLMKVRVANVVLKRFYLVVIHYVIINLPIILSWLKTYLKSLGQTTN